jgi:hypothetical protein
MSGFYFHLLLKMEGHGRFNTLLVILKQIPPPCQTTFHPVYTVHSVEETLVVIGTGQLGLFRKDSHDSVGGMPVPDGGAFCLAVIAAQNLIRFRHDLLRVVMYEDIRSLCQRNRPLGSIS